MPASRDDLDSELQGFLRGHGETLPPPLFPPGTIFGQWTLTAVLGRGGNAEVHCARDAESGSLVAVKILYRRDEASRRRFALERDLLRRLDTSAFPKLIGEGEADGLPYIVIELLEPRPLPRGDHAVAAYLVAIAQGVGVLHRLGYVHRDLKPRNVLFRKGGGPVIIDLGLVKDFTKSPIEVTEPLSVVDGKVVGVGTPRYAAPEQFSSGDVTPASDIHALGMLAHDCFGKHLPRRWERIVRKATTSIPEERFQDIASFVRAIRYRNAARYLVLAGFLCLLLAILAASEILPRGRPTSFLESRDLPETIDLRGQEVVWTAPVHLRERRTCRVIGPGRLDAVVLGEEGACLWMTNCVVVNRARKGYPENPLRYSLSAGVYLNLANQRPLPAARVGDFIETPDGASNDLDRVDLGPSWNDIRFGGPDSRSGLAQDKNTRYFRLHLRREP